MPDNQSGSPLIVTTTSVIESGKQGYYDLATSLSADLRAMKEVDDDLHNDWMGDAGNAYYYAYYTAEKVFNNIITRIRNTGNALDETDILFQATDDTAAGYLTVTSTNESTGDN